MGNRKRLTAFLLTAVMILTMPQMQIAAAEVESPADVGLCIHHTQHTEDCGYTEGEKETPCGHVHTEDCYAPIKQCVHEHGESCYPVAEDSATENTAEGEPHTCTHECSKESGCITEKLDCRHEHNADCGYSPATEGTPCTYECEICSGQEQINALPNVEDSPRENAEEIAALQAVAAETTNEKPKGEGTKESPYQITNAEELAWFRDTVNSGTTDIHARLLHDIDLNNVSWVPIGTKEHPYTGTFDGNAYTIRNFRLGNYSDSDPISEKGLFGWIGLGGTIQDVVVKVDYMGSTYKPDNVNVIKCGLIAAYNAGTIQRCSAIVYYTFHVKGEFGAIAYRNSGTIEDCLSAVGKLQSDILIPENASAAGIAYENSGTIKNCLFDGELRTELASALKNLQFTVENAENTQALKNAVETLYSADKKYKVYNPQFTNADESISLTGNSQIAYTIQTNYENAKVFVLNNGELEELDSVCLNGQIVFSDTKDEPFAVINNALSGKTAAIEYKSDSISYGYYMLTDDKYTENSLSGNTALEPQIKDTENGTEYYIGFRESLSQGAFSAFLSERSDVKVTIPYDKSKKIYLVRKVKEKKNAYVESTGSYDTVTEVDTDNAQIADGKITFTLLERNVTSNAVGSMVMDALYNGLNDKTDSIATAYILVSDKKLASMPENRKKEEGFISTPYYNGQTITLPTGAHYRLTAGTDSALDAGEYTCTTVPEDGYTWLDGSANPVTINWKIEKKYLKCKYVDETIKKGQTPAAKIEYTGFVNGETVETAKNFVAPTVTIPDNLEVGKDYKIKPTGGSADNYSLGYEEGTLKVRDSNSGTNTDKDKTQTVTANLYMDGKYNTVIPGVTVYMNNPNNPIEGTGTPTVPQANNATLVTKSDGTKLLTMDIENHVFTLQSIDGCKNAEVKSTEKSSNLVYNTTKDHNRSTRISRITFQLNDNSGVYEFTNCEEFPTIFNPENNWDNPLVLKVKFDGGKDSTLDSNKNVDTSGIGGGGGSKETTADITVKVSGDTATVSKINTKDVSEKNDLVLNVTDGAKDVTGAKLPVSDLKTIADAKVPNTTVKLSDASASLDLNALKAALKAAKGSTLDIRVLTGAAAEKKLSDAQKSALGDAKNGAAVYVEISSNGKAITDLATGKLTVTAPYKWDGKGSVQAWQMDENGKLTSVPVSYKDNVATLTLTAPGAILLGTTDAQVDTPAETKTFADVPANAYYKKAVDWAVENGITSGTSETTFAPDATCTRAQTVTFLWRAAGSPEPTKQDNPFTDVKADAYYYKAVLWAVEKGITSGTTATTFAPDATVSRAQVVSFQYRLAGAPKVEGTNVFTDVPANAYYRDAVLWAAQNGITSGTTATTFAPNAGCTRSQIVTFLYRQLANK